MNALILAQYFPPDMGGASTRAFNVAKGLHKKGCTIKVVTGFPHYPHGTIPETYSGKALKKEEIEIGESVRVWLPSLPHNSIINRIILHFCFIFSSLFALPFIGEVDVIWAANPNLFSIYPAIMYSLFKNAPIIRNVDDLWPESFYKRGLVKSKILRNILDITAWLSYKVPVAITPISPSYKQRIIEKYNIIKNKIHVIEVGVDIEEISLFDKIDRDIFIVMYSGILGVGYDFNCILKAAKKLEDYKSIKFVIRGIGEVEDKLRKMISEYDIKNLELDANYVSKTKLAQILSSADLFLLPMSIRSNADEGLPTKIFEYQAFGKPIICCSQGQSAKYIRSTDSGLVVKPEDHQALAEAILKLYRDEKLRHRLGMNGSYYVSQNLTSEKIGEQMLKVFSKVIDNKCTN
jgi:glycosyltransferase involved in cell wall biosynthesis